MAHYSLAESSHDQVLAVEYPNNAGTFFGNDFAAFQFGIGAGSWLKNANFPVFAHSGYIAATPTPFRAEYLISVPLEKKI